jgi:hypothetical protein
MASKVIECDFEFEHDSPPRALPPLRFGLRTLFWIMTLSSVVLAVFSAVGFAWASFLGLMLMLVALHVAGAVVGDHLRRAPRIPARAELTTQHVARYELHTCGWQPPAAGGLQQHRPIGRLVLWMGGLGALVGGACGGALLWASYGERLNWPALALGTLASAVIGAWFGFLASSFIRIARAGWREAARS